MWGAVIGAGLSILGAGVSYSEGRKQQKAQEKAAQATYDAKDELNKYQTQLEIRKQQRSAMDARRQAAREQIMLQSQQISQAHASGLSGSGLMGAQQYLAAQGGRLQANINYDLSDNLAHLGEMQRLNDKLAKAGADMERANVSNKGYGSLISQGAGIYNSIYGGYRPSGGGVNEFNLQSPIGGAGPAVSNTTYSMFDYGSGAMMS